LSKGTQSIIPIISGLYLGHYHISVLLRSEMYYLALVSLEFLVGNLLRKGFMGGPGSEADLSCDGPCDMDTLLYCEIVSQ
jgi:hypothetical protein